jgi:hypothetical protein
MRVGWAVWEKDWNVLRAQLRIEIWPSPCSVLSYLFVFHLHLPLIHPKEPESSFQFDLKSASLIGMDTIYHVTNAGQKHLPTAHFPKKTILKIYSGNHLHPSTYLFIHSFTISKSLFVCLWSNRCQAKCWKHGHHDIVGYGFDSLCSWVDSSIAWLWKEEKVWGRWKWRGVQISSIWEFLVKPSFSITIVLKIESTDLSYLISVWKDSSCPVGPSFCPSAPLSCQRII